MKETLYGDAKFAFRSSGRSIEAQRPLEVKKIADEFQNASVAHLFPSPVLYFDWPGSDHLNERLREIVFDVRTRSAGVVKTNRGGWQSDADLETWPYEEIQQLTDRIVRFAVEYISRIYGSRDPRYQTEWSIRAWANVNEKGSFNRTHDHLGRISFFSGVYYVDVGDVGVSGSPESGHTLFEDWTHVPVNILGDPNAHRQDFKMVPRNGRMVLFPAGLMHSVEKYTGDRPRITIAFNLHHPGFAVPRLAHRELATNWMWANFRGLMLLRRKFPEKVAALFSIPRVLASSPLPRPASVKTFWQYLSTATRHAFALASERFEKRNGPE